jgi:hypothetical protein
MFIIKQLPVLPSFSYKANQIDYIVPKVLELSFSAWDIYSLADDVWFTSNEILRAALLRQWDENAAATNGGYVSSVRPEWTGSTSPDGFPRPPFKWDEERRAHLRADLDGLYAHLYGLSHDEFSYILDTFPIVKRKDQAKYGEYRTKRLRLEAYDRLVDSDLIPPNTRALQRESVIGNKIYVPPAKPLVQPPPQTTAVHGTTIAGEKPAPQKEHFDSKVSSQVEQKSGQIEKPQPAPELKAERTELSSPRPAADPPAGQIPLMDYSLHKCGTCGKLVLDFDKADHTQKVHQGKDPGYQPMKK